MKSCFSLFRAFSFKGHIWIIILQHILHRYTNEAKTQINSILFQTFIALKVFFLFVIWYCHRQTKEMSSWLVVTHPKVVHEADLTFWNNAQGYIDLSTQANHTVYYLKENCKSLINLKYKGKFKLYKITSQITEKVAKLCEKLYT